MRWYGEYLVDPDAFARAVEPSLVLDQAERNVRGKIARMIGPETYGILRAQVEVTWWATYPVLVGGTLDDFPWVPYEPVPPRTKHLICRAELRT